MQLKKILQFIEDLKLAHSPIDCDKVIHAALLARFASRPIDDSSIEHNDIQFILTQFSLRWQQVLDNEGDYFLNPTDVNKLWIQLAKDLSVDAGKTYLRILCPNLVNNRDFNNLTLLTESERTENLYTGYDSRTLYRKRGLCEHLIARNFVLSTHRDIKNRSLRPLTIEELTRLKSCKQTNGTFSIQDEEFVDFWNFLQRKVFPRLNAKNEVPLNLLPRLLRLIDCYFRYKENETEFASFKLAASVFFKFLYKNELENINHFYGVKIEHDGKSYYLLDFLIAINNAHAFDLDDQLFILLTWLYRLNPALHIFNKQLNALYKQLNGDSVERFQTSLISLEHIEHDCKNMLLSLFTMHFEIFPFTGKTISAWDKTNDVFYQAEEIYSLFEPLIAENRIYNLPSLYQHVIKQYIVPHAKDSSMYRVLTTYKSTDMWYKHVQNGTLSLLGVNWYQPELLLHVLINFQPKMPLTKALINIFLDGLIHTYTQDVHEFQKQLRVNILFIELIRKLDKQDYADLKLLLQLYASQDLKSSFIPNCAYHIGKELSTIIASEAGDQALHFFTGPGKINKIGAVVLEQEITTVIDVVKYFKDCVHSPSFRKNIRLLDYLQNLCNPILSCVEQDDATRSVRTLDPLGAPT